MTNQDDFDARSQAFLSWLQSEPGAQISSSIKLADLRSQNQGRAVLATTEIAEGDVLFSIPRTTILSVENSGIAARVPEIAELDRWTGLIVTMMAEDRADSRWKKYFDVLPRAFTTPMFWSEEELGELAGTTVLDQLGKEEAETTYRDVVKPLMDKYPGVFGKVDCSLEAYHRMGSVILSYSFDVERDPEDEDEEEDVTKLPEAESDEEDEEEEGDKSENAMEVDEEHEVVEVEEVVEEEDDDEDEKFLKAMVPLADMLNGDSDLCNAKLFYSKDQLEMRATKPIAKDEQIFNTYGDLPNADLLRRYGYTRFGKTKNDVVEIPTQIAIDAAGVNLSELHLKKRMDFMLEYDEQQDEDLLDDSIQITISTCAIPTSALLLTYILMLKPAAFRDLRKQGFEAVSAIPRKSLKSAEQQDLWLSILRKKMNMYKTDVVTDENLILETKADQNLNLRNAIEVRLSEKRILEATIKKVKDWKIRVNKSKELISSRPTKRARMA
ncbi:hypothetical protein BZA70DRAFT_276993 [Myxozyma melibiosi]|uniref:Ribosomal lysine N-methyltransferase 4 n=1 Tax=Myxozyma melibiosi TaxID=54550 RepID=A0ABR1F7I4_9ASCO